MKVALAGAFGNLGSEILKKLVSSDNEILALDLVEKDVPELKGKYSFKKIDVTNKETLNGIFDNCDCVITTVGLTGASTKFSCYDIDYQGNVNLYNEAVKANVKKFIYISVIACDIDDAKKVPMLNSKKMFEDVLKSGSIDYVIHRPTGYFYDIIKVFRPYIEKGEMQLLKNYGHVKANVVDCKDFAKFPIL
jgi:nucleoside-diphosphate-sugar epimerase